MFDLLNLKYKVGLCNEIKSRQPLLVGGTDCRQINKPAPINGIININGGMFYV